MSNGQEIKTYSIPRFERKGGDDEEASAPFWMLTMGDMNTLLLTFFVLIYSMLSFEKPKYPDLPFSGMNPAQAPSELKTGTKPQNQGEQTALPQGGHEKGAGTQPGMNPIKLTGHKPPAQKIMDEKTLVVGGFAEPFSPGDWHLKDSHKKAIATIGKEINKMMAPTIFIDGHTDTSYLDSLVIEGDMVVPFSPKFFSDKEKVRTASHDLLGELRALEVKKLLVEFIPNVDEKRIIVRSFGYKRPYATESDPNYRFYSRDKISEMNRRVVIYAVSERQ